MTAARRRVLIAGCGDVGTVLGRLLVADGHRVFGLRRRPEALPPEIEPIAADLGRPETLRGLPAEIDTVVYTAAADTFEEGAYRRAYVEGLTHVLAALERGGARLTRLLYASSTAVYGQRSGEWVDEASPTEPPGFSGRVLLEGERVAAHAPGAAVVVRLAGIYGPGRTRLIDLVRSGRAVCAPGPPRYTNRIHRDDCAGVLRHLLTAPNAEGAWLGVDDEPADQAEVFRWLARELGVDPPPVGNEADGGRPRTSKRCSNAKLIRSGYRLRYATYREGYAAMLASAHES